MAGREGGGSGGIIHHGDESEWVQRREAGENRRLKPTQGSWVQGSSLFSMVRL